MTELFESARRKIERAKKHVAEFESELERFASHECPFEPFLDHDPERPGKDVWKLRMTQPFPEGLDEIVGDAVNNLRSALDHACYAAAKASGEVTPRNAYFPFGKTEDNFENTMRGNSKDVPLEIQALIRKYGPYKGGNDVLWSLNSISVSDKHLRLVEAGVRVANSFQGVGGGQVVFPMDPSWDHDKNEVEFAEFTTGAAFKGRFEFSPFVAFGEVAVVRGEPVISVLTYFVGIVDEIVSAIEQESRRLGPGR